MQQSLPVTNEEKAMPKAMGGAREPSAILLRTPWITPIAVKGEGIYLELADGQRLIDG
jgi:hypothetical protein